jgi:hypothetical protein
VALVAVAQVHPQLLVEQLEVVEQTLVAEVAARQDQVTYLIQVLDQLLLQEVAVQE